MHKAALEFCGLDGTYELIDVAPDQLDQRVIELMNQGYAGFNVTIPYKDSMFKLAHTHTSEAVAARAANTIRITENTFMDVPVVPKSKLVAHNTDIEGFRQALTAHFDIQDATQRTVCVLGAGGASRAALVALDALGFARILIVARDQAKAQAMLDSIQIDQTKCELLPLTAALGQEFDLIVNTTPLGQRSDDLPSWINFVLKPAANSNCQFFDMVYSRTFEPTPLVRFALERGWQAVDGKDMLVHQARAAFEFWTGKLPPFEVMNEAFLANLRN